MTVRREAIRLISALPDDADFEDIMYRLYVMKKVRLGQDAIKDGKAISSEQLRKEVANW